MLFRTMAVALILATAACGGSSKSRSAKTGGDEGGSLKSLIDDDAEQEDKDVIARRQCLGDDRKPKECLSDNDCCPGFYCGKDPEGSPRLKVCIDTGG
jgi:hypothetical protein